MGNIKINTVVQISVPKGTKVISSDEWLTLSRNVNGKFYLFTCLVEEMNGYDFNDDSIWMHFTEEELEKVLGIK